MEINEDLFRKIIDEYIKNLNDIYKRSDEKYKQNVTFLVEKKIIEDGSKDYFIIVMYKNNYLFEDHTTTGYYVCNDGKMGNMGWSITQALKVFNNTFNAVSNRVNSILEALENGMIDQIILLNKIEKIEVNSTKKKTNKL